MNEAHLKCVNLLGINAKSHPIYTSRAWDITESDAKRLVGGKIYFHDTKRLPSYFGGTVLGYEVINTDSAHSRRIVFTFESTADCRNVDWEGTDHINAHYSGIVEKDEHE